MESPSSRSLHLLSLLQSGREQDARSLSTALRVSERTVRRDIQRLRALGYDVYSQPGPGGAYRLRPSMKIPPLLLTPAEVSIIVTSLLALESWTPGDESATTARTKLEQVLPPQLRRRAAATALSTQIITTPPSPVDWELIGMLADAIGDANDLTFSYTDQHGNTTARRTEPYRHILRGQQWYLIAYDLDRDDWRTFRLDRIRTPAMLPATHEPHDFPFTSIEEWLRSNFGDDD